MKSEREIRDKLDELFERLDKIRHSDGNDESEYEGVCCNIDALLWVIGDRSGKPI